MKLLWCLSIICHKVLWATVRWILHEILQQSKLYKGTIKWGIPSQLNIVLNCSDLGESLYTAWNSCSVSSHFYEIFFLVEFMDNRPVYVCFSWKLLLWRHDFTRKRTSLCGKLFTKDDIVQAVWWCHNIVPSKRREQVHISKRRNKRKWIKQIFAALLILQQKRENKTAAKITRYTYSTYDFLHQWNLKQIDTKWR